MTDILDFGISDGDFCPERRDDIVTYVFHEMGPGAADAFEAHLASCDGCRNEVASLGETLRIVAEASAPGGAALSASPSVPAESISWEDEWTILRRRLLAAESFEPDTMAYEPAAARPAKRHALLWLGWAASVAVIGALAFSAGLWRGVSITAAGTALRPGTGLALPPVSGASIGNYFDNLDDFTKDTHNFLRRTRMVLMEFSNLGADSNPTFYRESCTELLAEVTRYQEVAKRMHDPKLSELLDQISSVLRTISHIDQSNQEGVIAEVKKTLGSTGLMATLDLLDAANEREAKRLSNV